MQLQCSNLNGHLYSMKIVNSPFLALADSCAMMSENLSLTVIYQLHAFSLLQG